MGVENSFKDQAKRKYKDKLMRGLLRSKAGAGATQFVPNEIIEKSSSVKHICIHCLKNECKKIPMHNAEGLRSVGKYCESCIETFKLPEYKPVDKKCVRCKSSFSPRKPIDKWCNACIDFFNDRRAKQNLQRNV